MKKILILGNSPAGVKLIEELRATNAEDEITIFPLGETVPGKRESLLAYLADETAESEAVCRPQQFFEQQNVRVVAEEKIDRINFNRRYIVTAEKEKFNFDILIIADTPNTKWPSIKGTNKAGIFSLHKLSEVKEILNSLTLMDTVVVESDQLSGLQAAYAFAKRGKEVFCITSSQGVLAKMFDPQVSEWIRQDMLERDIRLIEEQNIAEVLGEKDAKAVKLASGKVIATQVVIFNDAGPDFKLFADSPLTINQKIRVNQSLKTNLENVYAVDEVCEIEGASLLNGGSNFQNLGKQGETVAAHLKGEESPYAPSLRINRYRLGGFTVTLIGQTESSDGLKEYSQVWQSSKTYKKIFVQNNIVIGAVLINVADEEEKIIRLIQDKICLEDVESLIGKAEDSADQPPDTVTSDLSRDIATEESNVCEKSGEG